MTDFVFFYVFFADLTDWLNVTRTRVDFFSGFEKLAQMVVW